MKRVYFNWLAGLTDKEDRYLFLLKALHRKEFFATVPNDDNRGEDGKKLREEFLNYDLSQAEEDFLGGPCTLLEMLIALSRRMEPLFYDTIFEAAPSSWFWEFLYNLDLTKYDNHRMVEPGAKEEVDQILTRLLERTYDANGEGGIFPLQDSYYDQTKEEIWYQMSYYALEKLNNIL